jgi:excisionase family DNA binding protein
MGVRFQDVLHFWLLCASVHDGDLLTVSEAAAALSASTQTVRNWVRAERLHGVRIGNRFFIPREEVERFRGGDVPGPRGEGPWDFEGDASMAPLPRAAGAPGLGDPAEGLLGA